MPRLPFERESARGFPPSPGVYIFMDGQGRPLYVGKAKDLRSRVRAYFGKGDGRPVSLLLGERAAFMDFVVTDTAREALILENSLIKKHAPVLNIRLKDDKTYFSLRLDPQERWPRLTIVRRRGRDRALYFGPYTSAHACRRTIQYLNRLFPLRTCPDSVLDNRSRPCLSHEIGNCAAPCVDLVTGEAYAGIVERVVRFLSGRDQEVLQEVEAEMLAAAERLEFERAADLRDRLRHMRETLSAPRVSRRGGPDRDVIGLHDDQQETCLAVLHVRDGQLASSATFTFRGVPPADELLAAFLGQFYGPSREPPQEILMPRECADLDVLREILEEVRGLAVSLRVPERGEGRRLLDLAERNAELSHRRREAGREKAGAEMRAVQERLGLFRVPERVECFDISHLAGEQVVGSCVSFLRGHPDKGRYRHYRLREVLRNDDFAAMEEVLRRRLRRGVAHDDLPDLLLIDGGLPQLRRVESVMRELRVDDVHVAALAKARRGVRATTKEQRHERVWLPGATQAILLEDAAPETRLLSRIRDEAHRFAITYSRRLRAREKVGTVLEMIPGVGHRRARTLLERLGSVRGVREAEEEELASVPGISPALAERIRAWFEEHPRALPDEPPRA